MERARRFGELKGNPSWRELRAEVIRKKELWVEKIAHRIANGQRVNQVAIDRTRAFYEGAIWILDHPEKAEEALERAAKMALSDTLSELDNDTQEVQ